MQKRLERFVERNSDNIIEKIRTGLREADRVIIRTSDDGESGIELYPDARIYNSVRLFAEKYIIILYPGGEGTIIGINEIKAIELYYYNEDKEDFFDVFQYQGSEKLQSLSRQKKVIEMTTVKKVSPAEMARRISENFNAEEVWIEESLITKIKPDNKKETDIYVNARFSELTHDDVVGLYDIVQDTGWQILRMEVEGDYIIVYLEEIQ
ncbi:MAG: hypothetical protein QXV17_07805 [Candidatus Micrarchaeaceae archaeon]